MKKILLPLAFAFSPLAIFAEEQVLPLWHQVSQESVYGVGYGGVSQFIEKVAVTPRKQVVVAVIDGGVDFSVDALKPFEWCNSKEIAGNGKDDDRNGYIDDINGWNFLGNGEGENIIRCGTAEFREYKRLRPKYAKATAESINPADSAEFAYFKKMDRKSGISTYIQFERYLKGMYDMVKRCDSLMHICYGDKENLSVDDFRNISLADTVGVMKDLNGMYMALMMDPNQTSWDAVVKSHRDKYEQVHERISSLDDPAQDAHRMVGNDPLDFRNLKYGNNHTFVDVDDAMHATMVSGLVSESGAICGADLKIMSLRVVGDGDEYDRDVVAAIYYAVKNGAKVINCSFGKQTSEAEAEVIKAIRYAERKDVVIVRASGNENIHTDVVPSYPTGKNRKGDRFKNMIIVGAADSQGRVGEISNYGRNTVDLFAPGMAITSVKAGHGTMAANGTSLASPIVASIAAMIRSYFPDLSAKAVADILRMSVRVVEDDQNAKTVANSSIAGGVVDAAAAMECACALSKYGK